MNKTMEYMSFALPVVSFDLAETRISGGDAVEYVPATAEVDELVVEQFALTVTKLLDDPDRREQFALAGRRRAERELDWAPQRVAYLGVYDRLTGHASPPPAPDLTDPTLAEVLGGALLDVTDDDAVRYFGRTRRLPAPPPAAGHAPPGRRRRATGAVPGGRPASRSVDTALVRRRIAT